MTEQSQLDRIEAIVLQNAQAIQQGNERMGRIESVVAENSKTIDRNAQAITTNTQAINQLTETVNRQGEQLLQQGQRQETILYETQRLISKVGEDTSRANAVSQQNRTSLETLMRMMQSIQADILRLQVDVRGVQVENQRILRHLFGEGEGRED